ncbi:uncharacterized protein LOC116307289 isoform X3 [Actinia tenebrosa]|uniref:Uncharacterized protein LOC116307289 isoform X2 n=1 Tax=Actinia tenebrosa TaxID=6105 RepID=A0A6P8J0F5_ACTTE|nr:uncharacterized protein LOC116307289 isoform X2 [Actinia tenebrosa]XP_031573317.1 uncharacterized protein LOC116307289 isoform X3 [Actinia tenebrosa]
MRTWIESLSGACNVISPENPIICHVGDEALFNWTTDDGRIIYSANWGIKNGNHPDSQFINTNVFTTVVNYNKNMDPKYRPRVYFVGNLKMGRAWFKLKNVSLNDDLKYVANIRESKGGVLAYIVQLKVKKKANITWTTQVASTHVTDATATSIKINDSFDATSFSPKRDHDHHYAGLLIAVLLLPLMWSFLVLISLKKNQKR